MEATTGSAPAYDIRPDAWLGRRGRKAKLLLACAAGLVLVLWASLSFPGSAERAALVLLTAPPWIIGFLMVRRTGVRVGRDGVVIRGFIRTNRVGLPDARRFVPGMHGWIGNGYPAPGLERVDGKVIPCFTLGREGFVGNFDDYLEEMQVVCDELNPLLRRFQEESGQATAPAPPLVHD